MQKIFNSIEEILGVLPENHRVVAYHKDDGVVMHGESVPQDLFADESLRKLLAGAKFFDEGAVIVGPPHRP